METELPILMLSAASLVSAYENPKTYIFVAKMQFLNATYAVDRSLFYVRKINYESLTEAKFCVTKLDDQCLTWI